MEVVPAVGKLFRFCPQIDYLSFSVRSGNPRDDIGKHVLTESLDLGDTSIHDETRKDTAVVGPSAVSKRVRFANSVSGWLLVGMCLADPHVGNTEVGFSSPVTSGPCLWM